MTRKYRDRDGRTIREGDSVRVVGVPDLAGCPSETHRVFRRLVGTYRRVLRFDELSIPVGVDNERASTSARRERPQQKGFGAAAGNAHPGALNVCADHRTLRRSGWHWEQDALLG